MSASKGIRGDMTVGSPMRLILAFSIPLLLGNVLQQMYNMVDSIVVGNYVGTTALGGGWNGRSDYLYDGGVVYGNRKRRRSNYFPVFWSRKLKKGFGNGGYDLYDSDDRCAAGNAAGNYFFRAVASVDQYAG